jgi:hypothetical protein
MPPEELEKMHHIEKHIRKNKMKVGGGCWLTDGSSKTLNPSQSV